MESVDDRAGALAGSGFITDVNHAVEKLIPLLDQHRDAAACGDDYVYARQGLGVRPPKTKAIILLVLVHEMDPADPRFHLNSAVGDWFLIADSNRCGPGQGSCFFCFCCSCCSHGESPFEAYCFPRGRKLGSARSPARAGRS